jgi:hypothetical protein
MPIIFDPDDLVDATDVVVNTTTKTIRILTTGAVDDEGATGGVTGQCLYSWLKERWKANDDYIKFPFPMEAITPEQFEFINGWLPFDDATRKLIRTAGWAEKNAAGAVLRQYMGVVSLGDLGETDQPYYRFGSASATDFAYEGPVNEAIQIFGDASNGNFNFTDGTPLDIFCREQGKTYTASNNTAIGAPTLTYITYRFPLSNGVDLNIDASDVTISTTAPWTNITIEYYGTNQDRDIGGTDYPFRIIIDSDASATTQQIYEKIQYLLRQDVDIDSGAGTVNGKTADELLRFVGPTLVGAFSVFVDNLNANFLNAVEYIDQNGVTRTYPFVAAGTINFGGNAGSGDFKFWMFFTTNPGGNYGTADAIVVNDADGTPIQGTYAGSPVPFSFAYDANTQGGRTAGTDAGVTVLGIGLEGGQFIAVEQTIGAAVGQNILLAPAQERVYVNPV